MAVTVPHERQHDLLRGTTRTGVCNALALIGVIAGVVPLFLHRWVHVAVTFVPRGASGGVLQRLGTDLDKQVAAVTEGEVNATISPTMWGYAGHHFQAVFALLLLVTTIALLAPVIAPRFRTIARGVACAASIGAALVVGVAFLRIQDRIATLPERIMAAMERNVALRQSLNLIGAPQVSGGPGWPMIAAALGVALTLIGTLAGLIIALRALATFAILPHDPQRATGDTKEDADGERERATTVPDDGPTPDAH